MKDKFAGLPVIIIFMVFLAISFVFFYGYLVLDGDFSTIKVPKEAKVLGVDTESGINYNFEKPEDITYKTDDIGYNDMQKDIESSEDPNAFFQMSIPKIDFENEIEHTNNFKKIEEEGMILLPWTYLYQDSWFRIPPWKKRKPKTEGIIICYRRFYGPSHQKSCFNLHLLEKKDEIIFDGYIYKIKNKVVVNKDKTTTFTPSEKNEYLKIVTNSGPLGEPDMNTHHLVIIASKDSDHRI